MSLYGTMRTGVSGMNAQANRLSTVADNIANASTTGYKRASTEFSSMILPPSGGAYNTGGLYHSGGVLTDVRYSISAQGNLTPTNSATDLAIKGEGFFVVTGADGVEYLTRAGAFTVMDDGSLRNSAGFTLMGYEYSPTEDPTIVVNGSAGLREVNLSSKSLAAKASLNGTLDVNLPSNEAVGFTKTTSLTAYDSQGNTRLVEFTYTKTADNTWTAQASYEGTDLGGPVTFSFGADGRLASTPLTFSLPALTFNGADFGPLAIDVSGSTQLATAFDVTSGKIDGNGVSRVVGYEIDGEGIVHMKYANGDLIPKYRVAMASVQSPDNLRPLPGNVYSRSPDSGVVVMGYAGNGGFGSILSHTLEDSNVDIAEELTTMIESQRNYTANSKVFQTGSELMEVLVNLKR